MNNSAANHNSSKNSNLNLPQNNKNNINQIKEKDESSNELNELNDEEFCLLVQENLIHQDNINQNTNILSTNNISTNNISTNNLSTSNLSINKGTYEISNNIISTSANMKFNFNTDKNKEKILNSNNQNVSTTNTNNNINTNITSSTNNINYTNSSNFNNLNNESKVNSQSFNKMYHTVQRNNTDLNDNNINNNKNKKEQEEKTKKKKRNIFFQLISKELVSIESDFFLEPALMTIIKEHQGRFDREERHWLAPYKNYIEIFSQLKQCSAIGETSLFPITNLPIEVLSKINYQILNFKIDAEKVQIDYTKDRLHSIFELPSSMVTNLYNFQKVGIEFGIKKKGRMLLADEMGVGKTIQAIGIAAVFQEDWPVLILCPSSLKYNWRDEILNWLKDTVTENQVQIIKTSKEDLRIESKFYICSYDMSIRITDKIIKKNFRFAIADEAHYLKSREAKRTKQMLPVLQKCKRVLMLSGTPILAKPVEIFPILQIVRPDLFHNFKAFGTRYCDPRTNNFGVDWNGSGNTKELNYLLNNIMLRRLKKDVLSELPPKKRQKVEVQCDKKIISQIKFLLGKSVGKVDLENQNLIDNILNQNGNENNSDDVLSCFTKAYAASGKAKLEGIVDYIGYLLENNCKFLIFAHHVVVLDGIEEEVKKQKVNYVRIDGSVNNEKRHLLVHKFQNDDTCLVAVLGLTACSTGLTLTKASTVVFAEMHFTPAVMIQAEDRAHRIGQEHNCVNVHYLYGVDTVDEIIFPKLREKFFVVSSTLDNKRLDMDLQKIKSGLVGDFETKGKSEMTQSEEGIVKTIKTESKMLSGMVSYQVEKIGNKVNNAKNKTLTDFFKVKIKGENIENIIENSSSNIIEKIVENKIENNVDNNVDNNCYDSDGFNELIEGLLYDEEFIKSLPSSAIKLNPNLPEKVNNNNNELEDESTDFTTITNINLHQDIIKRDRTMFDSACNNFALLENSEFDEIVEVDEEEDKNNNKNNNNKDNKKVKINERKRKVEIKKK